VKIQIGGRRADGRDDVAETFLNYGAARQIFNLVCSRERTLSFVETFFVKVHPSQRTVIFSSIFGGISGASRDRACSCNY